MKITRQNGRKLFLMVRALFSIVIVSSCSTKASDPIYYRPSQQPAQKDLQQQYHNPPSQQYYQPYAAPAPFYYSPVVPRSRYYSNPYSDSAYGNYDSDYYYSAPNYANPYNEQQRGLQEERAKSAGVADDKF